MKRVTLQGFNRWEQHFVIGLLNHGHPTIRLNFRDRQRTASLSQRPIRNDTAIVRLMIQNGLLTQDGYVTPYGKSLVAA